MFCTKCGAKNPEDATFCYKCGNEMYTDKTTSPMVDDTTVTTDEIVAEEVNPLIDFWINIINFEGKMNRHNFWVAVFVMALINIVIVSVSYGTEAMILWYFYDLFFLIATLSASVRRLHDINKSGAYVLLNLIPLVGQVILLIMLLQKGKAKSYSEAWWSGLFAASTLLLLLGGVYTVTTAYEYYQEQQELQEYRDDLDKSINDLENNSYDSDYDY